MPSWIRGINFGSIQMRICITFGTAIYFQIKSRNQFRKHSNSLPVLFVFVSTVFSLFSSSTNRKTRLSLRYERSGEAGEILVVDFFVSTVGTLKEESFRYCLYYSVHSSCGKRFLPCVRNHANLNKCNRTLLRRIKGHALVGWNPEFGIALTSSLRLLIHRSGHWTVLRNMEKWSPVEALLSANL
ncbi:hypothetical protein SUGI_0908000 [Cryptomeria japonica]|nr:hypothetical protein SUGI_0908000 [Cryptomeria japonica]